MPINKLHPLPIDQSPKLKFHPNIENNDITRIKDQNHKFNLMKSKSISSLPPIQANNHLHHFNMTKVHRETYNSPAKQQNSELPSFPSTQADTFGILSSHHGASQILGDQALISKYVGFKNNTSFAGNFTNLSPQKLGFSNLVNKKSTSPHKGLNSGIGMSNTSEVFDALFTRIIMSETENDDSSVDVSITEGRPEEKRSRALKKERLALHKLLHSPDLTKKIVTPRKIIPGEIFQLIDEHSPKKMRRSKYSSPELCDTLKLFKSSKSNFLKLNGKNTLGRVMLTGKDPIKVLSKDQPKDSQPLMVKVGVDSRIIQPAFMINTGTMCFTELWNDKFKSEYHYQFANNRQDSKLIKLDDVSYPLKETRSLYRPDHIKTGLIVQSKLKSIKSGNDYTRLGGGHSNSSAFKSNDNENEVNLSYNPEYTYKNIKKDFIRKRTLLFGTKTGDSIAANNISNGMGSLINLSPDISPTFAKISRKSSSILFDSQIKNELSNLSDLKNQSPFNQSLDKKQSPIKKFTLQSDNVYDMEDNLCRTLNRMDSFSKLSEVSPSSIKSSNTYKSYYIGGNSKKSSKNGVFDFNLESKLKKSPLKYINNIHNIDQNKCHLLSPIILEQDNEAKEDDSKRDRFQNNEYNNSKDVENSIKNVVKDEFSNNASAYDDIQLGNSLNIIN